jgi:two-component system, NarL family, sensor kinase
MDSLSSQVTIIIIASIFFIIVAIGIIILILVYQKRQLQFLNDKNGMQINFDKELFESQLEIKEQTLKSISQEIHDNIGQMLSLAKLNINTMNTDDPAGMQERITASKELITKAIQDLRDISKSLNTDHIKDLGLTRSVEYELAMMKKSGNYSINFEEKGEPYRLDPGKELIIFRIMQEVLQNIIKHACASSISVLLQFGARELVLQIGDNGTGFDADMLNKNRYDGYGLGLRNIYNRAKIINADFRLVSTLEKGTTVTLTLKT